MKKLKLLQQNHLRHWVGDGFPVRSIFSYRELPEEMSPFLLMDYAGPENFPATEARRGVGEHPHRGFETVTIVYDGEVEHKDSSGGGGQIGPGDVQWMTAARGIIHEEYHGRNYAKKGGPFEMIQLWVNLPKKDKMSPPGYQNILDGQIPRVELADQAGFVRVIAGEYSGKRGPARTFSPINVWDVRVKKGKTVRFDVQEGYTTALFVLKGKLALPTDEIVEEADLALLEREGTEVVFTAKEETTLLFLNGQPLNEPVVGYGPFVMNTEAEIRQAYRDFHSGNFA